MSVNIDGNPADIPTE